MTKEEFIKLVDEAHNKSGIISALLEKDFYITNILRELVKKNDNVVFKGGTSLSKAYKVINRFSEDVDVTLKKEVASQSKIREFNKLIENVCFDKLGLKSYIKLQELHPIRHKGMSNIYYLDYNSYYNSNVNIKPYIELDSSFITKVEDTKKIKIQPMIQDVLNTEGAESLEAFEIYVQSLEMIIADKFFAICKNYRRGNVERYSRHFYDIACAYKIIQGKTDNVLRKYIKEVAEAEKIKYSANENVEVKPLDKLLLECCNSEDYRYDYEEDLPVYIYNKNNMPTFDDCTKKIKEMIKDGMFNGLEHYFIKRNGKLDGEQKIYIYEFVDKGDILDIKNLTQNEFQGKYCKKDSVLAEKKINVLRNNLREKGKIYNETRYYMIPVVEGSNTYFIVGQNINRTIALEIGKKELQIK